MPPRKREPVPPVVDRRTPEEKAERQRAEEQQTADRAARQVVDHRSQDPVTAPPHDRVADALMSVVADAVFAAIHSPDFGGALLERGLAVTPACTEPPQAPLEWAENALDLFGAYGSLTDPVAHIDGMYAEAFQHGWQARAAAVPDPDPAEEQAAASADNAWHSVWLYGKWKWITENMTTEERELAAAAVHRYSARLDPDETITDSGVRWWRY